MSASNLVSSFTLAAALVLGAASSGCYVVTAPTEGATTQQASIDTDATMTVKGGAGAGAFVEYASGGHWDVYTSCDFSISGQPCLFNIIVATASATLSNPQGQSLGSGDAVTLDDDGTISLNTQTTTDLDGMTFDVDPGATVEIDMTLDGVDHPELIDWVSAGQVVQGAKSDPVDFVPTSP